MTIAGNIVVALVALLHIGFMVLEMFLWTKPVGMRVFKLGAEFAQASKTLAANQGLYNGFLAAGLIWGLLLGADGYAVKIFFLACVVVAGLFGGLTISRRVFWIQAFPAAIGVVLICLGNR